MLILTRRAGESVHIGDQIQVKILTVRGNQVRLGIDAPREVKVYRDAGADKTDKAAPEAAAHAGDAPEPPAEG